MADDDLARRISRAKSVERCWNAGCDRPAFYVVAVVFEHWDGMTRAKVPTNVLLCRRCRRFADFERFMTDAAWESIMRSVAAMAPSPLSTRTCARLVFANYP